MRKILLKKRRTTDEGEETEDPRGGTRHQVAEDSCHSTNRGVSTPGLLRALKSPSTLTGPAHQRYLPSAGGSIYRRADAFPSPSGLAVAYASVHINRDNRGSPGAAYRVGGWHSPPRGWQRATLVLRTEGVSHPRNRLHANGRRLYCEKGAPYEHVKWEMKQKMKREREKRRREMYGCRSAEK